MSSLLDVAPVVPVVVLTDETQAVPLARALAEGGLPIIELTLGTPSAIEAIRRIAAEVPEILVGAGTILDARQAEQAAAAGAQFLVSPGTHTRPAGRDGRHRAAVPAGDLDRLGDAGRGRTGPHRDRSSRPRPQAARRTWPRWPARCRTGASAATGGITAVNAGHYLKLPNVGCVGGSCG